MKPRNPLEQTVRGMDHHTKESAERRKIKKLLKIKNLQF